MIIGLTSGSRTSQSLVSFLIKNDVKVAGFYDPVYAKASYENTVEGLSVYIGTLTDKIEALVGFPYTLSYEFLENKNSDNKFIFIDIDKADWVSDHMLMNKAMATEEEYFWEKPTREKLFKKEFIKISEFTEQDWSDAYDNFKETIHLHFTGKDNFISVHINDSEISDKLNNFLGFSSGINFEIKNDFRKNN